MLLASWKKNDKKAITLIVIFSVVVFATVSVLGRVTLTINPGFNVHVFAKANAVINSMVGLLLLCGLIAVKAKRYFLHKRIMLTSMFLSILFLISYICHHLLAGEAKFGDVNHDGILSNEELKQVEGLRNVYLVILFSHIFLAAVMLPFILFTAYRGLTAEFAAHKKLARYTWPLWFYIAVTGPVIYRMISPYYH